MSLLVLRARLDVLDDGHDPDLIQRLHSLSRDHLSLRLVLVDTVPSVYFLVVLDGKGVVVQLHILVFTIDQRDDQANKVLSSKYSASLTTSFCRTL